MDETRPSPFFALFRFRVLYWTQTDEQKTGEAWERGYKRRACAVPIYACGEQQVLRNATFTLHLQCSTL